MVELVLASPGFPVGVASEPEFVAEMTIVDAEPSERMEV